MLKVTRVQGSGQYCAQIGNGFIRSFVYGSSPSDALGKLAKMDELYPVYRPYVVEIARQLREWKIGYVDLAIGINTGTMVL